MLLALLSINPELVLPEDVNCALDKLPNPLSKVFSAMFPWSRLFKLFARLMVPSLLMILHPLAKMLAGISDILVAGDNGTPLAEWRYILTAGC